MAPMYRVVLLTSLLLAACKAQPHHQSVDPGVRPALERALDATLASFPEAPQLSQRARDHQLGLLTLAASGDAALVAALVQGQAPAELVHERAGDLLGDLRRRRPQAQPPGLLIYLQDQAGSLSHDQLLLLLCLTNLARQEAQLNDVDSGLPTGR